MRRLKGHLPFGLNVGGARLAAEVFPHGVVEECALLLCPVLVGSGKPALAQGVLLSLRLLEHRRFGNGVLYVRYAVPNLS